MQAIRTIVGLFFVALLVSTMAGATNFSFNDPLVDAADAEQKVEVFRLLGRNHPIDSRGDFSTTALMRAAYRGNTDIVKMLVQSGAVLDLKDRGGATAMHLAARSGHVAVVQLLVKYGANIEASDKEGWTPLMRAVRSQQSAVVNVLVEAGADIAATNQTGESSLVHAAKAGSMDILATLMASGSFASIPEAQKSMALAAAKDKKFRGIETVLSSLLGRGPLPNQQTSVPIYGADDGEPVYNVHDVARSAAEPVARQAQQPVPSQQMAEGAYPVDVPHNGFNEPEELLNRRAQQAEIASRQMIHDRVQQQLPWQQAQQQAAAQQQQRPQAMPSSYTPPQTYAVPQVKYLLQLGAFDNEDQAYYVWTNLKHRNADILQGLEPDVLKAFLAFDQSEVFRLRASEFTQKAHADEICDTLRERSVECFVVEKSSMAMAPQPMAPPAPVQQQVQQHMKHAPSAFAPFPNNGLQVMPPQGAYAADPNAPYQAYPSQSAPYSAPASGAAFQQLAPQAGPIEAVPNQGQPYYAAQPQPRQASGYQQQAQDPAVPQGVYEDVREMTRRQFFHNQGASPPAVSHNYGDFYEEIQQMESQRAAYRDVSEAVRVAPRPSAQHSQSRAMPVYANGGYTNTKPGIWIQVGDFPSEDHAQDYYMRMFKYDKSFGHIGMVTMKENVPFNNFQNVSMRLGPTGNEAEAYEICRIVRHGGLQCRLLNANATAGYQQFSSTSLEKNGPSPFDTLDPFWLTLGTFESNSDAEYYWMFLLEDHFDVLGSLKYDISKRAQHAREPMHLRAGPFQVQSQAGRICQVLKYRNIACLVTH